MNPGVADCDAAYARIVGRGLVARALSQVAERHDDVVIFVSGTGNSSCRDGVEFARERERLEAALEHCCRTDRRMVYCSSAGAVYGVVTEARHERTPCRPTTLYGSHNLRCEALIRESDCRFLILRIANLIGPRANDRQLLPNLVRQVLNGHVRVLRQATRDLIGHERFASIVDELLGHVADRDTVVVASGIALPVPELVAVIQRALQTNAEVELVDAGSPQRFCVEKLRALAPKSARLGSDDPWSVVRELVPRLAEECVARSSRTPAVDEWPRSWPHGWVGAHKDVSCSKDVL
ncbi:MAG: putative NDP-hexose 4-ketoreductase [Planctomycetota bacterium]|nr:MAG: putative NDP-hexose 4-ketoreductase [Planctomycetota bacterium]